MMNIESIFCVIHIAIRISLANKAPITDCDEVYNYWEPLHFLLYESGMQTWEYAPQYALRTYAYLLPMTYLSKFYKWILSTCCSNHNLVTLANLISPSIVSTSLAFHSSLSSSSPSSPSSQHHKVLIFHLLRATIAFATSIAELKFVHSISLYHSRIVAIYTWFILLSSTGMFHTSPAYLPSTTVMICLFLSLSEQLQAYTDNNVHNISNNDQWKKKLDKAIIYGLVAVLMTGWPFCAILFIPLGLFTIIKTYSQSKNSMVSVIYLITRVLFYSILIQCTVTFIDYIHYGKILSPTLNIFIYNTGIFGGGTEDGDNNINRDELYGVEDISYYIKNLILNWNMVAMMGIIALPLIFLVKLCNLEKKKNKRNDLITITVLLVPMILWIGTVFSRPHKEERFLFPIYPFLAFGSALLLNTLLDVMQIHVWIGSLNIFKNSKSNGTTNDAISDRNNFSTVSSRIKLLLGVCALAPFTLFSISRSVALSDGYTAPLKLYTHLYYHIIRHDEEYEGVSTREKSDSVGKSKLVCIGGEWYRFPSSFHLPKDYELAFLKSSFGGQLPQQFTKFGSKEESLSVQNGKFNDLNEEEHDRYVSISQCSYLIDLVDSNDEKDEAVDSPLEISQYIGDDDKDWELVAQYRFLDAENTSTIQRVLFLPFKRNVAYKSYALFQAKVI